LPIQQTGQPSWIFNKFESKEIWGKESQCNDPSGENEERAQLGTDEWGTKGKYHSSESIHCYQNQALDGHSKRYM